MQTWWDAQGFWVTFLVLFAIAWLRGQATYGLARWLTTQTLRRTNPSSGRWAAAHAWLASEGTARGRASLQRWGLAVIPVSYLTVGFQTLVLTAAGVTRVRWVWFTLAQLPGALAWALIYATIGFAVWQASLAAAAGSPWALLAFAAIAVVYAATLLSRRRQAGKTRPELPNRPTGREGA